MTLHFHSESLSIFSNSLVHFSFSPDIHSSSWVEKNVGVKHHPISNIAKFYTPAAVLRDILGCRVVPGKAVLGNPKTHNGEANRQRATNTHEEQRSRKQGPSRQAPGTTKSPDLRSPASPRPSARCFCLGVRAGHFRNTVVPPQFSVTFWVAEWSRAKLS